MPISATGNRASAPSPDAGFTLIELMVVLAIIGVLAAAVIMTIPDPRGRLLDEAARFAAHTVAARDLAIVEGRPVAVRVTARGYAFDRRLGGNWVPIADPAFHSQPWSQGTVAIVGQGATIRTGFDATGQPSAPANIVLARPRERTRISIAADGGVRVGT